MPHAGDEGIVATGFYRLGVYDDEPDDKRAAEFDGLDDMLRTSSETFLERFRNLYGACHPVRQIPPHVCRLAHHHKPPVGKTRWPQCPHHLREASHLLPAAPA